MNKNERESGLRDTEDLDDESSRISERWLTRGQQAN